MIESQVDTLTTVETLKDTHLTIVVLYSQLTYSQLILLETIAEQSITRSRV